jgi:hypothetical protein
VAEHLKNAPSESELRYLQALKTAVIQNASFWIGASSEREEVFSAIRNVIPTIEPDPRHLAGANLDPRRIAFLVVERARVEAPADFAEGVTDNPDQAEINVHVLQTMILRSLEHLQRVALTEWSIRNFEVRRSVRLSEAASPKLTPDPSNDGFGERPPKLMSGLAAELSNVGHAAPALDTALPGTNGDLETELQEALNVQLNWREPGSPTPDMEVPEVSVAPEAAPAGLPDAVQSRPAEATGAGETRPELAAPASETEPSKPKENLSVRFGFLWLVVVVAVGTTLAALFYRNELCAVAASVLDLFPSWR